MKKLLLASLMAMMFVMVASATIIDDFTSPNQFTCNPTEGTCGGPASSAELATASDTINGRRTVSIIGNGTGVSNANVEAGSLNYSTPVAGTGSMTVLWDNLAFDLASTGEFLLSFNFFANDNGGAVGYTVSISDGTDVATSGPTAVPAAPPSSGFVSIGLASFANWGAIDQSNIDSITFNFVGNTATDISFDNFMFATPEPSTLVLLGSALVGLAFYRRRK